MRTTNIRVPECRSSPVLIVDKQARGKKKFLSGSFFNQKGNQSDDDKEALAERKELRPPDSQIFQQKKKKEKKGWRRSSCCSCSVSRWEGIDDDRMMQQHLHVLDDYIWNMEEKANAQKKKKKKKENRRPADADLPFWIHTHEHTESQKSPVTVTGNLVDRVQKTPRWNVFLAL